MRGDPVSFDQLDDYLDGLSDQPDNIPDWRSIQDYPWRGLSASDGDYKLDDYFGNGNYTDEQAVQEQRYTLAQRVARDDEGILFFLLMGGGFVVAVLVILSVFG